MSVSAISSLVVATQASVAEVAKDGIATTAKVTEPSQVASAASMLGGLILVLLLIFALAYLMKRFNLVPSNHNVLKTLAVTSLGQKERLVLVQVGEQQYLLGVSGQQVNLIDKLAQPIEIETASFAEKLRQAKLKQ
ncbi:flagellar biosynthetic protein FliO [Shewanella acanthi]|uniref:flagellar biosynthetic protein FliO n=1 Tax=Shewanella acanthi TaxID=2864212 RepID=UPI001C65A590|nr:flagellar biosynthetic protein FliO [Shewanella acanthi]QYJ79899.1 flagellar biosynthetic protein FliO [Shewanella acanthi]